MAEKAKGAGVGGIHTSFLKPTQAELFDHFRRVAECTSLPVVLYNNPATCGGLSVEPDTVARLAELPNVVGIKDSSGDLQNTIEIIRRVPESFGVLNGRDTLILAALLFGAKGDIPAACKRAAVVRRHLRVVREGGRGGGPGVPGPAAPGPHGDGPGDRER